MPVIKNIEVNISALLGDADILEEFDHRGLLSYKDLETAIGFLQGRGYTVTETDEAYDLLLDIYYHMKDTTPEKFQVYMRKLVWKKLGRLF